MGKVLKQCESYLKLLRGTPSKPQRKALLDTITVDQAKALSEIAHNFLEGNIPVAKDSLDRLRKHKTLIRQLGNKSVSIKRKRQLVCKRGTVILLLLTVSEPTLKKIWSK